MIPACVAASCLSVCTVCVLQPGHTPSTWPSGALTSTGRPPERSPLMEKALNEAEVLFDEPRTGDPVADECTPRERERES